MFLSIPADNQKKLDKALGCFVGLAVGDALGAPVEFMQADTYEVVTDYQDGGPFSLKAGQYTDDTSQALCLAETLLEEEQLVASKFLDKLVAWYRNGYLSCNGICFDVGIGTACAIDDYIESGVTLAGSGSGNGSLMRLAPLSIFLMGNYMGDDIIDRATQTTHGGKDAVITTRLLGRMLGYFLETNEPNNCYMKHRCASWLKSTTSISDDDDDDDDKGNITNVDKNSPYTALNEELRKIWEISLGRRKESREDYTNQTGWCVTSFTAAFYCLLTTNTFEGCVKKAVNLGGDTDTVGAIAGQMAGALYGFSSIPQRYIEGLQDSDKIIGMAGKLFALSKKQACQ